MDRSLALYNDATWDYSPTSAKERLRLEALDRLLPADVMSVLDAGCGQGQVGRYLLERHKLKLLSLDIVPAAAKSAPGHRLAGSLACLPLRDGSVDAALCGEVLEHLPGPLFHAGLDELVRVARRYVLISVPCRELLSARQITCPVCGCRYNKDWHLRRFDTPDLEQLHPTLRLLRVSSVAPRGPVQRLRGRAERAHSDTEPDSPCPLCGARARISKADRLRALLLEGLDALARLELRKPAWLVALYRRKDAR